MDAENYRRMLAKQRAKDLAESASRQLKNREIEETKTKKQIDGNDLQVGGFYAAPHTVCSLSPTLTSKT